MISFIIPAHNEEKFLPHALQSIHAAAKRRNASYEIVVVNDASTDGTTKVAEDNGARVIPVELRKIGAVRNAGARQALGEVLVFLDADTTLPARTLHMALSALHHGAVGGGAIVAFDAPGPLWPRIVMNGWNFGSQIKRLAAGCFVFARRDVFEKVGGFDERYYCGEELILSNAIKRHGPFIIVRHPVITSSRKTQTHSLAEMLGVFAHLWWRGEQGWQERQGKDMWYVRRES